MHAAGLLATLQVPGQSVPCPDRPLGSFGHHIVKCFWGDLQRAFCPDPGGYGVVQGIHQVTASCHILFRKWCREEPHPAVDIETNSPGRDDPLLKGECGNPPDGEPVSPVNIRHGKGMADDPGKSRHVCQLLDGARLQGLPQRCGEEEPARNPHVRNIPHRHLPFVRPDPHYPADHGFILLLHPVHGAVVSRDSYTSNTISSIYPFASRPIASSYQEIPFTSVPRACRRRSNGSPLSTASA